MTWRHWDNLRPVRPPASYGCPGLGVNRDLTVLPVAQPVVETFPVGDDLTAVVAAH